MTRPVNIASVKHLSVFRYPGGKTWFMPLLKRWLKSIEEPKVFVEPFGGGGIASLTAIHEKLVSRVVIIEKDPMVASVWRACLSKDAAKLAARIRNFNFTSKGVSQAIAAGQQSNDRIAKAFSVILLNRVRRGGVMAEGAGLLKRGENDNGLSSRWYPETLARRIEQIFSLSDKISFRQTNGLKVIDEYRNWKSAAIFADPPYTLAGKRLYSCWKLDHEALFKKLSRVSGSFIATYDDTSEIRRLAKEAGIKWKSIPMKNTGHTLKSELVLGRDLAWMRAT